MPIFRATKKDIPALVALMNSAYRGEASKQGWTTEADLIEGELRTDDATVEQLMKIKKACFLKYMNDNNEIGGCIFLQKKNDKLYLGMLSVSPLQQAKGIGRQLMNAAYAHGQQLGCNCIFMKVISLRHELISWYEKQGYFKTGEREPFPADSPFWNPHAAAGIHDYGKKDQLREYIFLIFYTPR